ncbi:MAG: site-specific integrase [Armatimonadota bacterium]|nr:site-specific integrase [Armatimonadota bacterium]
MTVFQRRDGRWQATVSISGRRKTFYGRTEVQARRKAEEFLRRLGTRPVPDPGRRTVRDVLEAFLRSADLRPRTRADYEDTARRYLGPLVRTRLVHVEPLAVVGVLEGLPPRTALKVYRLLHRVMRYAVQLGYLASNPLDRIPPPRYRPPRKQPWSPDEASQFLQAARSHPLGPLFWLLATTGLRTSEALALRWSDLDLASGVLRVERSVHRVRGQWVYTPPKTQAGQRSVALPQQVVAALRALRRAAVEEALRRGAGFSDEALVFSEDGQPLHHRRVLRAMQTVARRAGVRPSSPHQLRHLHASALLSQGAGLAEVARRLGHASPAVTAAVYSHALRDDRELAERSAKALGLWE